MLCKRLSDHLSFQECVEELLLEVESSVREYEKLTSLNSTSA
jgi:hypothetical protein